MYVLIRALRSCAEASTRSATTAGDGGKGILCAAGVSGKGSS